MDAFAIKTATFKMQYIISFTFNTTTRATLT